MTKSLNGQIIPKQNFYSSYLLMLCENPASLDACFPLFCTPFFALNFMKLQLTPLRLKVCGLRVNQT